MRNGILSLFSYVPFPSMYLIPFPFHFPFQKSVFHNTAGQPGPEGQLQAHGGQQVFVHICQIMARWIQPRAVPEFLPQQGCEQKPAPEREMQPSCSYMSPAECLSYFLLKSRIRPHTKESLNILPFHIFEGYLVLLSFFIQYCSNGRFFLKIPFKK